MDGGTPSSADAPSSAVDAPPATSSPDAGELGPDPEQGGDRDRTPHLPDMDVHLTDPIEQ